MKDINGVYENEPSMVQVNLIGIQMSKYLVTQQLYEAVMGKNPSHFKGALLPVEMVSWHDVQAFIERLNKITGKAYRLPTEYEWMIAASVDNTIYSGSDTASEVAWTRENSNSKTHVVGTKKPNSLGLYDMSGNVWEWCQDLYDESRVDRVIRGGSWDFDELLCRCTYRFLLDPGLRSSDVGFRLVLPL